MSKNPVVVNLKMMHFSYKTKIKTVFLNFVWWNVLETMAKNVAMSTVVPKLWSWNTRSRSWNTTSLKEIRGSYKELILGAGEIQDELEHFVISDDREAIKDYRIISKGLRRQFKGAPTDQKWASIWTYHIININNIIHQYELEQQKI